MAIKLTATLVEPFSYISLQDDAIDGDHEDFAEEFRKYREGTIAMPPLKDGKEPTVFVLRPLTDPELSNELAQYRDNRTKWLCEVARYSIAEIRNLDDDGKPVRMRLARSNGFPCIPDDIFARLHGVGRGALLQELGMAVLTHNSPS